MNTVYHQILQANTINLINLTKKTEIKTNRKEKKELWGSIDVNLLCKNFENIEQNLTERKKIVSKTLQKPKKQKIELLKNELKDIENELLTKLTTFEQKNKKKNIKMKEKDEIEEEIIEEIDNLENIEPLEMTFADQ